MTTYRFDQIADNVNVRVMPGDTSLDRYVGLEHLDPETLQIRHWGSPADVIGQKLHFWPGDIIYGRRRAYQRKVAIADFEGICSAHAMVLRAKPEVCLPELFPFFLQSETFHQRALEISVGSLSPTINWRTLAEQEFPLPPLNEQRRIARLLWAVEEVFIKSRQVTFAFKKLWGAVAFHYFGIGDGRNEYSLNDLLEYGSDGPFGSKLKTEHYVRSGVRVIRLQNIQENYFDDADQAYISREYYEDELVRYTVKPGDVLVAGLGDNNIRAGRTCIAPNNLGLVINKADCYCLRPKPILVREYLVAFLNSPYGLRQSDAFAQGTTRFRLNLGNIKRMRIPVPDLETQKEIAEKLDSIEQGIKVQEIHIERLTRLKKALMSQLLS